jgi:FAD:protein FMN transferase
MRQIEFRAMGSHMMAALDTDDSEADRLLEQVPEWFERWEQSLSRFRPNSELSMLNSAGYLPDASPTMAEVVTEAIKAAQLTGGLVNPAMLPAVEAAGYDRTFDILDPDAQPFRPLNQWSDDWRGIEVKGREVRLPRGVRIDLGGIAKGWAADRAARGLAKHGPALVDAGGDISITGSMSDGTSWPIGISDPFDPEQQLHLLALGKCGVATSGRDFRRWQKGGVNQHHIIDPRTGKPSTTDVLSATVVGPNAGRAEVAAKAAFLLGSHEGLAWIEKRPEFACFLVLENGETLPSTSMPAYFWPEAAG